MPFKPKFISFDCYGTLINFEMGPAAKRLFEDRVPAGRMPPFLDSFRAYRLDEVLGDWKTASDLGFMAKAFIDRGHEPTSDNYGVSRLTDIRQLPGLLGL